MTRTRIIIGLVLLLLTIEKVWGEYCVVGNCEKSGCVIDNHVFDVHSRNTGDVGIVFGITSGLLCGIILLGGAFLTAGVFIVYGR